MLEQYAGHGRIGNSIGQSVSSDSGGCRDPEVMSPRSGCWYAIKASGVIGLMPAMPPRARHPVQHLAWSRAHMVEVVWGEGLLWFGPWDCWRYVMSSNHCGILR